MSRDPELDIQKEWLGLVQPVGLVVSPPALLSAQRVPQKQIIPQQERLRDLAEDPDWTFPVFAKEILGWADADLLGTLDAPLPDHLPVFLPDYGETLHPSYAVPDVDHQGSFLLLVQELPPNTQLDAKPNDEQSGWHASPQAKFERLLRERDIPAGILHNREVLRLCYAPKGETSGHLSFPMSAMLQVAGRPILSALVMLLSADCVFSGPPQRRLLPILAESRKYQAKVSTQLSEQVLFALLTLLRGVQSADVQAAGALLDGVSPKDIYGGLLTTLLRLVFLLYAEERTLLPTDPVYLQGYSITALFDRLREDSGNHPDTMDQRYGAWAQLLSLFRLVYDGASHGACHLPARHGELFDPDQYPFLEGRRPGDRYQPGERLAGEVPRIPDGVVERVLTSLLVLSGERLSYRALDVEQLGSVYEAMMGYEVVHAEGPSLALMPHHVLVNLAELLQQKPAERIKWLKEEAACELSAKEAEALRLAKDVDGAAAALCRKVSPRTPHVLPPASLYLQPGEERRRSGSHYTPRSLTEPIVRTTLSPVLSALGQRPTPEQILAIKVCDPAMGSGAFLVEACRQLGEALERSWELHKVKPEIPADEEPVLHARRLVALRCLYGVDKNRFAVGLAKLSLWLVTLAREQPFTFLDHALRHGDSLVGLTRGQIAAFRWDQEQDNGPLFAQVGQKVAKARAQRRTIHELGDRDDDGKRLAWKEADDALHAVRVTGDLVVAAYFSADKDKAREKRRCELQKELQNRGALAMDGEAMALREGSRGVVPFHWEVEFPEVFERDNPGFDVVVGNPPFAGKNNLLNGHVVGYVDWLKLVHEGAHGNADLSAHFFRRAFGLLRQGGAFGLIATNTIAQGDTRSTGLRWICTHGGSIFAAQRRLKWPGAAAVVVSVVHTWKGPWATEVVLDGRVVPRITAFLFHGGGHEDPAVLQANEDKSFQGSIVLGMGFTFDDTNEEATSLAEMGRLIAKDPRNQERIFPYLGGEEINSSPDLTKAYHRYVINFGEMSEDEARRWPDLMDIVEQKVKPERAKLGDNADAQRRKKNWWLWGRFTPALYRTIAGLDWVLTIARISNSFGFALLPNSMVFNEKIVVFPFDSHKAFCIMQSRIHEIWARFFSSTMKDDLQYTPSDCFETFPFPEGWEQNQSLEEAGKTYYEYRSDLMIRNHQGLTDTYNRFHDPDETDPAIQKLRTLHEAMDRAVLSAYGWDLPTTCEFRLDYEEEDEDSEPATRKRKKPYRYRWPQAVHDEVLAKLLDLNQKRAEAERRKGGPPTPPKKAAPKNPPRKAPTKNPKAPEPTLFDPKKDPP